MYYHRRESIRCQGARGGSGSPGWRSGSAACFKAHGCSLCPGSTCSDSGGSRAATPFDFIAWSEHTNAAQKDKVIISVRNNSELEWKIL